jgi:hypothetical protein
VLLLRRGGLRRGGLRRVLLRRGNQESEHRGAGARHYSRDAGRAQRGDQGRGVRHGLGSVLLVQEILGGVEQDV